MSERNHTNDGQLAAARNDRRATAAEAAVRSYAKAKCGNTTDEYDFAAQSAEERLCDLLADLRHWARGRGVDFDGADRMAAMHFEAEVDEEREAGPAGGER